jgi:hypothetical protein
MPIVLSDVPLISVNEGPITPDSEEGEYVEGDTTAIWGDYVIENHYYEDKQIYMMGLTSPNGFNFAQGTQTVAFAQIAAPTLLWIMKWTVKRSNLQPKIPNPNPMDDNWIMLARMPVNRNTELHPDGQSVIYRVSGIYVYGHKRPSKDIISNIAIPRPAWMEDSAATRTLSTTMYENGLGNTVRTLRAAANL